METRGSLLAVLLLSCAGCAESQVVDGTSGSLQQEAARQTSVYHRQANSLREMADRRQLEADLMAREVGENDPVVGKKRRLAEELRAAADDGENKAHDVGRQVPHGMVQ